MDFKPLVTTLLGDGLFAMAGGGTRMSKDYTNIDLKDGRVVRLEFYQPKSSSRTELKVLSEAISELFGMAFWHSKEAKCRWQIGKIRKRLLGLQLVILAFAASTKEQIGYALLDKTTTGDHWILFVDSMGITPEWQGSGLGIQMFLETFKRMPYNIVVARTQNPVFVLMLQSLNPETLLPLTTYYEQQGDLQLLKWLTEGIMELSKVQNIDLRRGLCKEAYSEGKLGNYEIDLRNPKIDWVEHRFEELGLNRNGGDALIVLAKGIKVKGIPKE